MDINQVCEVPLNNLPAYDVTKDKPRSCDLCARKGNDNEQAFSYCPLCDTVYCLKHHEFHLEYYEEVGKVHPTINMEQYELLNTRQSRVCTYHKDRPIILGCRKCLKMNCIACVSSIGTCQDGECHNLMSLEELVDQLNDEINKLKKGMIEKEEGLEQIFKFTSQTLAEYDNETAKIVRKIHDKRDEQIQALTSKYEQLENEYMENRLKTKTKVTDFLEDEILKKWSQIRNIMRKTESRAKHAHQCDIVSSHSDTKKEIERLIDEIMPSVQAPSVCKVRENLSGSCEIMLEVFSTDGFLIDEQLKLRPSKHLPKSLKLLRTVSLPASPLSTRVWASQILAAMSNQAVAMIDDNYLVKGSFLAFNNNPNAMEVYKDKLYTLVYGNPWKIHVHDLQGKLVTCWSHNDSCSFTTGLAITCDKVVVPDRENKCLVIYSLTGNKLSAISYPRFRYQNVSLCVSGPNKVVVSDCNLSQVCLMDISLGQLLWTCADVPSPLGVANYGERYVLVAADHSSTVRILDSLTGVVVSELTDSAIESGKVYDMDISGDRLIVANRDSKNLAVFQLQP
ncbi:uncharacterized protein [Watersipora subatra]|uniref:uncharacterized protein n=1 Tax=Watersipora subatra TaxID=2589382 RepID=UPI00355C80F2